MAINTHEKCIYGTLNILLIFPKTEINEKSINIFNCGKSKYVL